MKTPFLLTAVLALSATVLSTQASATGMTYDPYENYYSTYYGIGDEEVVATTANPEFYDPYANYYNAYYGMDGIVAEKVNSNSKANKEALTDYPDMADPLNYYNW